MSKPTSRQQKKTEIDAATVAANQASTDEPDVANLASLLEKHRAAIAADFKAAFSTLEGKLDVTRATVEDHGQRVSDLEANETLQDQRLLALEVQCAKLSEINAKLASKMSDLESRSRRCNIRLTGLDEAIEGPQPTKFFSELLVELLGPEILPSPPELDRAHRALVAKPDPGKGGRAVIIRLHRFQIKDLIVREARKRRGSLKYRGKAVQIWEDYTPEVLEQRTKYKDVMTTLYNLGLKPSLAFPARLQITLNDGAKKKLDSPEKAAEFADDYKRNSLAGLAQTTD